MEPFAALNEFYLGRRRMSGLDRRSPRNSSGLGMRTDVISASVVRHFAVGFASPLLPFVRQR